MTANTAPIRAPRLIRRDGKLPASARVNGPPARQGAVAMQAPRQPPAHAARQRKLHAGHFAFMRSVIHGLEPRDSWERFFRIEGEATDQRTVRATIAWIRAEFGAAAKHHDRYGIARLVRLDAANIAHTAHTAHTAASSLKLPALEAFAEACGLEDESQATQTAAFEAEHNHATLHLRRRARLITRQLDALRWLETLVAQPPKAGDAVADWLNPALAGHLEAAGIFTLDQLVERINGVGRRWYAGIKAIGEGKAQRIVAWLRQHEQGMELRLGRHVAIPRSQLYEHELRVVVVPATDIRPLEKLIVPAELDGSCGLYRRPSAQCLLKVSTDYQAVLAWLRSKNGLTPAQKAQLKDRRRQRQIGGESGAEQGLDWLQALSNTQRAYRKEAERFLLWAITHRGKALSEHRRLRPVPRFSGRPAAAQPLVRRPRARARVTAVAAV